MTINELVGTPVMIRSRDAGVFYGTMASQDGDTVTLDNSRRIWYWQGAASLSELATRGPSQPDKCKFPAPITSGHVILGVIEIIPITPEALAVLDAVKPWSA